MKPAPPLILLVDDSAFARRTTRRIVEMLGYRVSEAQSGPAAVEACLRETPDMVLLDLVMSGGMDGFETLGALRKSHPHLPVVIVSADVQFASREAASFGGAVGFLNKPISVEELKRTLAAHTGTEIREQEK